MEAAHLEVRSPVMFTIHKLIQDQGLTQAKAARVLGVTQPRISDLVRPPASGTSAAKQS